MLSEFKEGILKENYEICTESSLKENYRWQIDGVVVCKEPIEAKGYLSLWEYTLKLDNIFNIC